MKYAINAKTDENCRSLWLKVNIRSLVDDGVVKDFLENFWCNAIALTEAEAW